MKKPLNGVFTADLHFDAPDISILYKELKLITKTLKEKQPDIFIIGGDIFHSKIFLNSKTAIYFFWFMKDIEKICVEYGIALRIYRGTLSHDFYQLDSLSYLYDVKGLDVKIMSTVTEEVFNGYNILYMPEEYITDQFDYYKEYFNNHYDLICAHGSWDFCNFSKKIQESENQMNTAPILDSKKFMSISDLILSGHYHIYKNYQNHIYYSGSFSRWIQGEEEPKGFLSFYMDDNSYKVKFIENKKAKIYKTLHLNSECELTKVGSIKKFIKLYIEKNNVYKLLVKVSEDEIYTSDIIEILKESFFEDRQFVKFQVTTKKYVAEDKQKELSEEEKMMVEVKEKIINADNNIDSIYYYLKYIKQTPVSKKVIRSLLNKKGDN